MRPSRSRVGSVWSPRRHRLLRAVLWVYAAPLVFVGVGVLVIFALGLGAGLLGLVVGVLQRVGW